MSIRVTIRGDRHLSEVTLRKIVRLRLRVRDELLDIARSIACSYRRRIHNVTGELGRSIEVGSFVGGSVRIEVIAPHAVFVERGTRAHVIEARAGGALRWTGSDGQVHFARRVRHPGTAPGNQLRDAVAANRRTLRPRIQRVLRRN